MPRTDVPALGQGKRSKKKAWRDNADQSIAIYNLAAAETPESSAIEDSEATSQALPYWDDDVPQPQSHSTQQTYTIEEAQDLVEMAFQEGWQQGMEEGYKLGKDKGYKEYKEHKVQEEEGRPRKAKKQANEATDAYQDTLNTPSIVTRVNATTQMDPAAPKACASAKTTHTTQISTISVNTTSNDSQPLSGVSRNPTSSISTISSPKSAQIFEIDEVDYQAVPSGTSPSILETTATRDLELPSTVPRSATSSITPIVSSPIAEIAEIAHTAHYNTTTSSSTTQNAYLHTGNTCNNTSDSYVAYFDPRIGSSNSYGIPEKTPPLNTSTPERMVPDAQTDNGTALLVNYDVQSFTSTSRTSPGSIDPSKMQNTSMLSHQLPPLPSLQPLNPSPYKRRDTPATTPQSTAASHHDPKLPKKPTIPQFRSQTLSISHNIIDSDIPTLPQLLATSGNTPPAHQHPTSSATAPTIIIHAQTVNIGGPTSTNISTQSTFDNERAASFKHSTGNSESKGQVPTFPTTPAMQPRDLSALRSNSYHQPFSSLRRRSHRRQSTSARPGGLKWNNNHHPRDWSQALQALGWIPPIRQSF